MMASDVSPLNLDTLPAEVIKLIVSMEKDSLESMRLISPAWKAAVAQHLSGLCYSLERVHLHTNSYCFSDSDDDLDRAFAPPPKPKPKPDPWNQVTLYALLPDSCPGARIGLGEWMSVHERFPDAIEVRCEPHKFYNYSNERAAKRRRVEALKNRTDDTPHSEGIVEVVAAAISAAFSYATGHITPGLVFALVSLFRRRIRKPEEVEEEKELAVHRFTRFFSGFSQIKWLVADDFSDREVLESALKTMDNIFITMLELRGFLWSDLIQKMVVELVNRHGIRHVIFDDVSDLQNFDEFVHEVINLGATIDIFETFPVDDRLFLQPRSFWDEKAAELYKDGISMHICCEGDTIFESAGYQKWVTAHMSIMTKEQRKSDFNHSIRAPRGYQSTMTR
ncbi:hypothetical protein PENTCL1PPCAC_8024 [Pristionchus entomophagus]|uniref:F-box domain-containing protein n=1 Tax=Pristionchus entomophagus TaxID=358040 RepID=A0AAV5SSL9_9BILA|nr:hypothetical protein PENTCL1PPCAC_8024 [Pristionchus entomophagus]